MQLDPLWQPERQQRCFRRLLDAMARPGSLQDLGRIANGSDALLRVLAVLADQAVTLSDPHGLLPGGAHPFLQAALVPPGIADYLVCDGSRPVTETPKLGELDNPETSCTLLVLVASLRNGPLQLDLSGPGIADRQGAAIAGLDPKWIRKRNSWCADFPLGVDMLLVDERDLVALPRTTKVSLV